MMVGDRAPGHGQTRSALRTLGLFLVVGGGIGTLIGIGDFFLSFASFSMRPPRFFWCAFLGLPALGIGLNLLRVGYAGRIARYHANEYTPVVGDALNTLAESTRPAQRAVRRMLREPGVTRDAVRCRECGDRNRDDANFCAGCGSGLQTTRACPVCRAENDHDAGFCDHCGAALA